MKSSEQIRHKKLSDLIYDRLKDDILQLNLSPGERIMVDEMAEKMGVSKTPFREALVRLEDDGYVISIPRSGTYVRKLQKKDIKEIYEIREMLEGLAGRLLAAHITSEQKEQLTKACRQFGESIKKGNTKACVKADFRFHSLILEMCGNEILKEMLKTFQLQIISIMETGPNYLDLAPVFLKEHYDILETIANNDAELAEKLIRLHIANGYSLWEEGKFSKAEASGR